MQVVFREKIKDASAWRATDFIDDTWIDWISAAEIDELETAAQNIQHNGLSEKALVAEDFDVPAVAERMKNIADQLEKGRGFVLIRGLPLARYDMKTIRIIYRCIGLQIGTPISQNAFGETLSSVTNRGSNFEGDTNARGYLSQAALPWHCDYSDVTSLLCVHQAKEGGDTPISSSMTVHNEIVENHPEYLDTLHRGFPWDLRGEGVTGRLDEVTDHDIPVYSYCEGRLSCSFNGRRILSARNKIGAPLSPFDTAAVEYIYEIAERPENLFRIQFQRGDIGMFSNFMVLHRRTKFTDHDDPEKKRLLLRLWINLYDGRPLASAFADRYNTGARSGILPSEEGKAHQLETLS